MLPRQCAGPGHFSGDPVGLLITHCLLFVSLASVSSSLQFSNLALNIKEVWSSSVALEFFRELLFIDFTPKKDSMVKGSRLLQDFFKPLLCSCEITTLQERQVLVTGFFKLT